MIVSLYLSRIADKPALLPANIAYPLVAGGWATVHEEDRVEVEALYDTEDARSTYVIATITNKGLAHLDKYPLV